MRTIFYIDKNPKNISWDKMWSTRTIEQELAACKIETAPRVMFLSYIPKKGKVIDGGCGFGKWVIYLHRRGYDIIGVDNNELSIRKLKEFDDSIRVEFGDILNLNYPNNYFDAYISMGVVEHFEDGPYKALKEAYRVLKPNGIIFLSTPTVNVLRTIIIQPIQNIINRLHGLFNKMTFFMSRSKFDKEESRINKLKKKEIKKQYYHFEEYRYSIKELHTFLKKSNFEVIKTLPHDFPGSKNHAIGLSVDFPFFRAFRSVNYKLNPFGKIIARLLEKISPWIACASVLCVGKALKGED